MCQCVKNTAPRRIRTPAKTSRASEPQEQRASVTQWGQVPAFWPIGLSKLLLPHLRIMNGFMEVSPEAGAQRQDVSFLKITVLHIRDDMYFKGSLVMLFINTQLWIGERGLKGMS